MIRMLCGDAVTYPAEAVVNSANDHLVLWSWIAGEIRKRGGEGVVNACSRFRSEFGICWVGDAVITDGGALRKKVIHAVVKPIRGKVTYDSIREATVSSVMLALNHSFASIAYPAFWTGSGKIPFETSAQAMKEWFDIARAQKPEMNGLSISILLPNEEVREAFERIFQTKPNETKFIA